MKRLFLIVVLFGLAACSPYTPSISSDTGKSIAQLKTIELGGFEQTILIRAADKEKPVLLFLHGGPGMPAMYLAHSFQRELEEHFVVVHWDQRGAGKSYSSDIDVSTINVRQYMDDAVELINQLNLEFGQTRIILLGHSWGSYLGMLLAAERPDLFYGYIGVGQVAGTIEQENEIQDSYLLEMAEKIGDEEAIKNLTANPEEHREDYLFKYGAELKSETSFLPLLMTGLQAKEYSLLDAMNITKGVQLLNDNMVYNVIDGALMDNVVEVGIPVFFLMGRTDYTTPFALVNEYFELLEAPSKELIYFDDSSHFPFYEEPELFTKHLVQISEKIVDSGD